MRRVGPRLRVEAMARHRLDGNAQPGRQLLYAANFQTMNALVAYLTENCCGSGAEGSCAAPVCAPGVPRAKTQLVTRKKSA